jgi:hypothetical protein
MYEPPSISHRESRVAVGKVASEILLVQTRSSRISGRSDSQLVAFNERRLTLVILVTHRRRCSYFLPLDSRVFSSSTTPIDGPPPTKRTPHSPLTTRASKLRN